MSQPPARRALANLRIGSRFSAVFGLILLLLLVLGLLFVLAVREMESVRGHARLAADRLLALNAVDAAILEQQSAFRGYLLSGSPEHLARYRAAAEAFPTTLEAARAEFGDPGPRQGLERIGQGLQRWREGNAEALREAPVARRDETAGAQREAGRQPGVLASLRADLADLRKAERDGLVAREQRLEQHLDRMRDAGVGLGLLGLAIMWLAVRMMSRSVAEPIDRLAQATQALSEGAESVAIDYTDQNDEVGAIARALEQFQQANARTRDSAWVNARVAEIAQAVGDQSGWEGFARVLLDRLCPALDAASAVVYRVTDDGTIAAIGGWAWGADRACSKLRFAPGEGLVGGVVQRGSPWCCEDLPADYPEVRSGTGSARPGWLCIAPLTAGGEVIGVFEYCALTAPEARQQQLFDAVLRLLGLAMSRLAGRLKTQELLEHTRAQAQSLRENEEALRATNEALSTQAAELEEQGERLRASEAELRAQAQELREANNELRDRGIALERASAELERRSAEVEQASRYKSEFLANMSHELRTPLNALLILARSLAENEGGRLDEEEVESAQIILESGQNLLRLINDILDLSKIEAGRVEVHRQETDLAQLARSLERQFRPLAEEKGLLLKVEVQADAEVLVDRDKLRQVLVNLLGNAIKFTENGEVGVRLSVSGEQLRAEVRDTGIGMDEATRERVFRAFEQADGSTSRRYGGTGLGLAISRRLAELMGGTLDAESTPGEGTLFRLALPLTRESPEADDPAAAGPRATAQGASPAEPAAAGAPREGDQRRVEARTQPQAPAGSAELGQDDATGEARAAPGAGGELRQTLLVVEDDPHFSRIVADMARQRGYIVFQAATAADAVAIARRERPQGIVLDVGLPDADGWSVLERLRDDPATARIPVHFVTADDDSHRARREGAVGLLVKPVRREDIEGVFSALLADGQAAQTPRRVLLVEDDPASRAAVTKLMADQPQIQLDHVERGADAFEQLRGGERYNCVILDLGLPDMSGFELLDTLEREQVATPPVVVYSARDLTAEETLRLRAHTESIVLKGAKAPERLRDEVSHFLHTLDEPGRAGAATANGPDVDLRGRRVLLVDDDVRNIFALSKTLRARGIEVTMAQDGGKAVDLLGGPDGDAIELVLMDIMMPGMDGYEAMQRIRSMPDRARLPIIALTAKAMRGDREKCLEAGASDYLSKPVDVDRLCAMMRVWLGAHG